MLDRLELCYTTCWEVQDIVEHHHSENHHNENRELMELDEYLTSLQHLTECIGKLYEIWKKYQDVLDSNVVHNVGQPAYRVPAVASGVGRPHFLIEWQQLEYLTSLAFPGQELQFYWV